MTATKNNRTVLAGAKVAPRKPATKVRTAFPAPAVGDEDWRKRAACLKHDPDLWFADAKDRRTRARATAVCYGCPVRATCLEWATATRQSYGIWGGVDFDQEIKPWHKKAQRGAHTTPQIVERVQSALDSGDLPDSIVADLGYKSMNSLVDYLRRKGRVDLIKRLVPTYRTKAEIMATALSSESPTRSLRRRSRSRAAQAKLAKEQAA